MTAAERRRIKESTDLASLQAWVADLERRIRAKVSRETDRITRVNAPGKSRDQRRNERNERAAKIREAVMLRADGKCEFCGRYGFALEWHHVIGAGLRRHREAEDTTAAICADCHRSWGRGDRITLILALGWAHDFGSEAAVGAIEKKIAKQDEARAAGGTR